MVHFILLYSEYIENSELISKEYNKLADLMIHERQKSNFSLENVRRFL